MTGKVGGVSRDVGVDEHVEGRVTGRETRRQTAGGQAAEGQMARGGRWAALLLPRAGLKRWLAVTLAGVALTGLGIGIGLRYLLASLEAPQWERLLTLGFLPDWLGGVLLLGEPLTPRLLAASAAILGGVALVVLLGGKRRVS